MFLKKVKTVNKEEKAECNITPRRRGLGKHTEDDAEFDEVQDQMEKMRSSLCRVNIDHLHGGWYQSTSYHTEDDAEFDEVQDQMEKMRSSLCRVNIDHLHGGWYQSTSYVWLIRYPGAAGLSSATKEDRSKLCKRHQALERMDSLLIADQINTYCQNIKEFTTQNVGKLFLAQTLQEYNS
ncbi:Eukaryotic translation initiation factor 3 subunit H [Fukomys damarensis]|uniref:Eukaryotic translation initiation factor 3 subunit H n=1 Tax=Fukomys damarensis TaxID=885580 RepID=A0A091CPY1_FUKDA|nr:Eukaryotic translation initiation factor 3 subunit H [Fukomys damarensis]